MGLINNTITYALQHKAEVNAITGITLIIGCMIFLAAILYLMYKGTRIEDPEETFGQWFNRRYKAIMAKDKEPEEDDSTKK